MIKINYREPTELETPDDIAVFNIKICDKYKKADYLELSCISWLKIDTKRNYQDLEQLFRHLNLDSYIIAQSVKNIPTGLRIGKPNELNLDENTKSTENNKNIENSELGYIAKITCMGKDDSIKELLKYHQNWEENFECLEKTGCFMSIKQDTSKEEEEKISHTKGVNEVKKLLECKLKLDFEYYNIRESIDFIINDLEIKYGKKPEKIICGEIETNKVWALMIDGQIVSPIGWIEKIINQKENGAICPEMTNSTIDYELVDFRKIKMERT